MTDNKITRRKFLEVAGSAGIIASAPMGLELLTSQLTSPLKLGRKLGKTDLFLSPVGFGAQRTNDPDLIRYALDLGVNHIETAWEYGFGRPGNNCECVGKAIKGRRDKVYLLAAVRPFTSSTHKWPGPQQFEQSLKDLGTDYLDVFLWKQPDGIQAITEEHLEYLQKLKTQGKVRWSGIIHHENQETYLQHVASSKIYDVAVIAFNYKSPAVVFQAVEDAAAKGVGIIAMKTQSPNFMTGVLGDAPDHAQALDWVISKKSITSAILGMTTKEQVDLNIQVMKKVLKGRMS